MKKEYFILAFFIVILLNNCVPKEPIVTEVDIVEPEPEIEPVQEVPGVVEEEISQPPAGEVRYVDLDGQFDPKDLVIKKGTTVVWTNNGRQVHRLIGKTEPYVQEKTFKLERIGQGDSINYTFTETGNYVVYSATFNYIKSKIVVE